jgi:hypothetical protein
MKRRKFLAGLLGAIASLPFVEASSALQIVELPPTLYVHPDGSWIKIVRSPDDVKIQDLLKDKDYINSIRKQLQLQINESRSDL